MCLNIDKNTKEAFLKKLKLCMQSFDYKDESKDVKGKVRPLCKVILFLNDRLTAYKPSTSSSRFFKTRKTS